jgi:hypothetical protein
LGDWRHFGRLAAFWAICAILGKRRHFGQTAPFWANGAILGECPKLVGRTECQSAASAAHSWCQHCNEKSFAWILQKTRFFIP